MGLELPWLSQLDSAPLTFSITGHPLLARWLVTKSNSTVNRWGSTSGRVMMNLVDLLTRSHLPPSQSATSALPSSNSSRRGKSPTLSLV